MEHDGYLRKIWAYERKSLARLQWDRAEYRWVNPMTNKSVVFFQYFVKLGRILLWFNQSKKSIRFCLLASTSYIFEIFIKAMGELVKEEASNKDYYVSVATNA